MTCRYAFLVTIKQEVELAKVTLKTPDVHPLIRALEEHGEATVELRGFLGTSEGDVVRLYRSLDTSSYVEFPKDAVVYLEKMEDGEPSEVRVFVAGDQTALEVRRTKVHDLDIVWPAPDKQGSRSWPVPADRVPYEWEGEQTFETCAKVCDSGLAQEAFRYEDCKKSARMLPTNRQKDALDFCEIIRLNAERGLFTCLNFCLSTQPMFIENFRVEDDSPRGFHYERFSVPRYHRMLMERHFGRYS